MGHAPGCLNLIIRNFFFFSQTYIYIFMKTKLTNKTQKNCCRAYSRRFFFLSNNNSRCLLFLIVFSKRKVLPLSQNQPHGFFLFYSFSHEFFSFFFIQKLIPLKRIPIS